MSIATVVTMGYGNFGSVNLLPTLGYSSNTGTPRPGYDYTVADFRAEYTVRSRRADYTVDSRRADYTVKK